LPSYNPFSHPHICTLKKYQEKDMSLEKMMFTDYPYLNWIYNNLERYRDKIIVETLITIGENPPVTGVCRSCKSQIASTICFYRADFLTSRGRTMNNNFEARCAKCEEEYLNRGHKHMSTGIQFSSILNFDTAQDRNIFVKKLKYAIGAPARLSNESAAKYFYDLFQSIE